MQSNEEYKDHPYINKFKLTPFVDFVVSGTIEEMIQAYNLNAQKANLQYPVIIKILIASTHKYAHSFFVINNEEGMVKALNYEGFKD